MRVGLLRVYSMLICIKRVECGKLSSNSNVLDLIQTAVTISHILYSPPSERTPRNVFRLYNVCWLHHELCLSLLPSLIGTKFFWIVYYHSLLIHGPVHYKIVCLRFVNTEANERMFNSVKVVADQCTNRHPDNVVTKYCYMFRVNRLKIVSLVARGLFRIRITGCPKKATFSLVIRAL